jgi:hypothetical protein
MVFLIKRITQNLNWTLKIIFNQAIDNSI